MVRPGGLLLVSCWALEQERKRFAEQDVHIPWHMQSGACGKKKQKKQRDRAEPLPGPGSPAESEVVYQR